VQVIALGSGQFYEKLAVSSENVRANQKLVEETKQGAAG
jgi:hypothetical protein